MKRTKAAEAAPFLHKSELDEVQQLAQMETTDEILKHIYDKSSKEARACIGCKR